MSETSEGFERPHDARELHEALISVAPDAIVAIDTRNRVLLCNPATERMFGHVASELTGRSLSLLMPVRFRAGHAYGMARYMATGERHVDWRAVRATGLRANGEEFPIVITFAETHLRGARAFLGFIRDLSAEEAIADALRRAERLHETLLTSVGEGIVGLDPRGIIQFANPAASAILGRPVPELLGTDFHEVAEHTGADGVPHATAACAITHALTRGEALHLHDERITGAGGARVHVDVIATPLRDGGIMSGAVIALRDIGEQQRIEGELRHALKMEAVGRLSAGIAHDFNNVLSVIVAHSEFLRTDSADPQVREDAAAISIAAQRAASLTRQLLAFSRKQLLVPALVRVSEVIAALEPMLRTLIGEAITFATIMHTTDDTVLVDRGQLEQVITNLVVNSKDAMAHGGALTVEVDLVPGRASARGETPRPPCVAIRVADTGEGMDATTRARAVEPFFTTKEVGAGTGLGLATVNGIVEQSGGTLEIESVPGTGTTVHVYLPQARANARDDARVQRVTRVVTPDAVLRISPRGTGQTILVVEDEPTVRRVAVRVLTTAGFSIIEARHGADALLVAGQHRGDIDLLLTDVVMPEVAGPELAEWFRSAYPGRPIVFMSGYTDDELLRQGVSTAQLTLVTKPFTSASLLGAISAALERASSGRE